MLAHERPWMFEFLGDGYVTRLRHRCFLGDDGMAKLAVLADHLSILTDVVALMATKATRI
jgi:hypothetical protein